MKFEVYMNDTMYKSFSVKLFELFNIKNNNTVELFDSEKAEKITVILNRSEQIIQTNYICFELSCNLIDDNEYYYILSQSVNSSWLKLYKSEEQSGKSLQFRSTLFNSKQVRLDVIEQLYLIELFNNYGDIQAHAIFNLIDLKLLNYSLNLVEGEVDFNARIKSPVKLLKKSTNLIKQEQQDLLAKLKKKIKGTTNVNFKQQFYMTYTDLLFRGLKLNITVAIDFTLSNGIQSEKTSLHYISTESNKYEYIINTILPIFHSQGVLNKLSAFGFGGIPNPDTSKTTEFLFALNGNISDPYVEDLDELINVYKKSIHKAKLSAPTNLHQLFKYICDKVEEIEYNESLYELLIILVDGDITDMNEITDLIVKSAKLPISILLFGIGDDQFERMNELGNYIIFILLI